MYVSRIMLNSKLQVAKTKSSDSMNIFYTKGRL